MNKIKTTVRQICLLALSFTLSACLSMGNCTFISHPGRQQENNITKPSTTNTTETFASTIETFKPTYSISGNLTAVSHNGLITGKITVMHGKKANRVIIVSHKGELIADATIVGKDLSLRHSYNEIPQTTLLSSWVYAHLGIDVTIDAVLSWINGHPHDSKEAKIITSDNNNRKCFSEEGWLICVQELSSSGKEKDVLRVVQISVPKVNINISVDRP